MPYVVAFMHNFIIFCRASIENRKYKIDINSGLTAHESPQRPPLLQSFTFCMWGEKRKKKKEKNTHVRFIIFGHIICLVISTSFCF